MKRFQKERAEALRSVLERAVSGWDPHVPTVEEDERDLAFFRELFDDPEFDIERLHALRAGFVDDRPAAEWRADQVASLMHDINEVTTWPSRWSPRSWRWLHRLLVRLTSLGALGGGGSAAWGYGLPTTKYGTPRLRGKRHYWLGKPTGWWECLLRGHHWPSPHQVGFGMCAKCAPCPECGKAVPLEHECAEARS